VDRQERPKHASWLNQIECWFSILARQLLARGSLARYLMFRDRVQRVVRRAGPAGRRRVTLLTLDAACFALFAEMSGELRRHGAAVDDALRPP
jgi:hypothetical protein